ncbi:hypothetical protein KIN20_023476 [Parelaphostrongylus tenuis]|uniref:Uncharacterized protein n=1 Tax=Parelaphostrongylus tenuis TaxID=148309 RepID=A0AAD5N6K6_PARTN|nr:hypothetical protein KIN20_023476 [Parelaphostrongylus tenuis]
MIGKLCSIMSTKPSTQYNHQVRFHNSTVKSVEIGTIDAVLQLRADHIERDPQRTDVSAMIWFLGLGSRLEEVSGFYANFWAFSCFTPSNSGAYRLAGSRSAQTVRSLPVRHSLQHVAFSRDSTAEQP